MSEYGFGTVLRREDGLTVMVIARNQSQASITTDEKDSEGDPFLVYHGQGLVLVLQRTGDPTVMPDLWPQGRIAAFYDEWSHSDWKVVP